MIMPALKGVSDKETELCFNAAVSISPNGTQKVCYKGGRNGNADAFKANAVRRNSRTYYEVAIPWTSLSTTLEEQKLCFSFVVFDNNSPTMDTAPYWLEFAPGLAGGRDPWEMSVLDIGK